MSLEDFFLNGDQAAILDKLNQFIENNFLSGLYELVEKPSPDSAENHSVQVQKREKLREEAFDAGIPRILVYALDFELFQEFPETLKIMLSVLNVEIELTQEEEQYMRSRFNL